VSDVLVLDKSVFEAASAQDLCDFAPNHALTVPGALIHECEINPRLKKKHLLSKVRKVVTAGTDVWSLPFRIRLIGWRFNCCCEIVDIAILRTADKNELRIEVRK